MCSLFEIDDISKDPEKMKPSEADVQAGEEETTLRKKASLMESIAPEEAKNLTPYTEHDVVLKTETSETEGQIVFDKDIRVSLENLPSMEALMNVGIILTLNDTLVRQSVERIENDLTLSQKGILLRKEIDLPGTADDNKDLKTTDTTEEMTLITERHESLTRTTIRMRIIPAPASFPLDESIALNIICRYLSSEVEEQLYDSRKVVLEGSREISASDVGLEMLPTIVPQELHRDFVSPVVSKGEVLESQPGGMHEEFTSEEIKSVCSEDTEYLSDEEGEEFTGNQKAIQTDITLGELLFSESIASISAADLTDVGVQTYISALEAPCYEGPVDERSAEENAFKSPEEYIMNENETESQRDSAEDIEVTAVEDSEPLQVNDIDVQEAREMLFVELSEQEKSLEETRALGSGQLKDIPMCLIKGDPPWIDPPTDIFTVMWDTQLEVTPNELELQYTDTVFPIPSQMKMPKIDPLEMLRQAQGRSLSVAHHIDLKNTDDEEPFSVMSFFASSHILPTRGRELFNIHIDLNTWGFPAALHERYALSIEASEYNLNKEASELAQNGGTLSTGEFLYQNIESSSVYSIFNPLEAEEDQRDNLYIGFGVKNDEFSAQQEKLQIKDWNTESHSHEIVQQQNEIVPDDYFLERSEPRDTDLSDVVGHSVERTESLNEEPLGPAMELNNIAIPIRLSSGRAVSPNISVDEEDTKPSSYLPLVLVLSISDRNPLILLMDPEDLPISVAVGTKNIPVNSVNAVCTINKFEKNLFRINNIELSESAITNIDLENAESTKPNKEGKIRCKIKVDGEVRVEVSGELGPLSSPVTFNLPLEEVEAPAQVLVSQKEQTTENELDTTKTFVDASYDTASNEFNQTRQPDTSDAFDKYAHDLQWQDGLPVPAIADMNERDISDVFDELENLPVSGVRESVKILNTERDGVECIPSSDNENRKQILKELENEKFPIAPENIEDETLANKPEYQNTKYLSQGFSSLPTERDKLPIRNICAVLNKTLKEFEQQISPLRKALDEIKQRIRTLEVQETSSDPVSCICSDMGATLSRTDSGYEQEIAKKILSAQKECLGIYFQDSSMDFLKDHESPVSLPWIGSSCSVDQVDQVCSSSHIRSGFTESLSELRTPCFRKSWLREEGHRCLRHRYMVPQRATVNMPVGFGITCLVPASVTIVPSSPLTHLSWPTYKTSSELGCTHNCNALSSENLMHHHHFPALKKVRNVNSLWTSF